MGCSQQLSSLAALSPYWALSLLFLRGGSLRSMASPPIQGIPQACWSLQVSSRSQGIQFIWEPSVFWQVIALAINLPWVLILLLPALVACHCVLIVPEEKYLAAKFGEQYTRYAASVHALVWPYPAICAFILNHPFSLLNNKRTEDNILRTRPGLLLGRIKAATGIIGRSAVCRPAVGANERKWHAINPISQRKWRTQGCSSRAG